MWAVLDRCYGGMLPSTVLPIVAFITLVLVLVARVMPTVPFFGG